MPAAARECPRSKNCQWSATQIQHAGRSSAQRVSLLIRQYSVTTAPKPLRMSFSLPSVHPHPYVEQACRGETARNRVDIRTSVPRVCTSPCLQSMLVKRGGQGVSCTLCNLYKLYSGTLNVFDHLHFYTLYTFASVLGVRPTRLWQLQLKPLARQRLHLLGNHGLRVILWLLTQLRSCTSLGRPWSGSQWVPLLLQERKSSMKMWGDWVPLMMVLTLHDNMSMTIH